MLRHTLTALLSICLTAAAAQRPDNPFVDVNREVVTPHIAWAKPYARGATKVLVVAPAWGQRETVELAQRFDFDCHAVMTYTHRVFSGGSSYLAPDRVAERMDSALARNIDCIVIGGFDWKQLMLDHRFRILSKVHEGAGLVYVAPPRNAELAQLFAKSIAPAPAAITAGVPWSQLTAFAGKKPEDVVTAGAFGKGRWVRLNYRTNSTSQSLTPRLSPWPAAWEYDYYQSLLGRAILWAAAREPTATIDAPPQLDVERSRLPTSIEVTTGGQRGALTASCWDTATGQRVAQCRVTVASARARVELPTLAAGRYIVNLWLRDDAGRVLAWRSARLTVTASVEVAGLSLDRDCYDAGQPIAAKVELSRALARGERLRVRWSDNHGRLLREETRNEGAEFAFEHPGIQPLGTAIHWLEAAVVDERGVAAAARREFPVRGRPRPAFHLAAWEEPQDDYISALTYRALRSLGVDAIYYTSGRGNREAAARLIAEADLFGAPSFAPHRPKVQPGPLGPVHDHSLHDPAYRAELRERAIESCAPFAKFDVLFYPSGSDVSMRGQSFDAQTLAALRVWLRKRYGSLERLNAAWRSEFASWDAVVPLSFERAKKARNFASWVEHVRFMEESFAQYHEFVAETLKAVDPHPLAGQDGFGRLDSIDGADWWRLLRICGFYNLYTYQDPPQMEITRSLAAACPNVELRSLYYGSYNGQFGDAAFMRRIPWFAVLHGYNGLFWWVANGKTTYPGTVNAMLGPDFRPTRSYAINKVEIDMIRARGVVEMFAGAKRLNDGIAIYYDQTAVHAVSAYAHPSKLVRAYQTFQDLIEDAGLQYDYVAGAQLEHGALAGYKVLVLAHAQAMSKAQAHAIRAFVQQGGAVIADALPAQYDYLLRPVAGGSLLADTFGDAGKWHAVGAGETRVLAEPLTSYRRERYRSKGPGLRQRMASLLGECDITPRLAVTSEAGCAGIEVVAFQRGAARFVGIINHQAPRKLAVNAPQARHVYDVRAQRCLGEVANWSFELDEGETGFFALLPYRVERVDARVEAPEVARGGRGAVTIRVVTSTGAPAAGHAVAVQALDPAGQARAEYASIVTTDANGRAHVRVPFALNDPTGAWTVRATDTISGESARVTLSLK